MDDKNFTDPLDAKEWIDIVESAGIRDLDIYPRLRAWIDEVSPAQILEIGSGQGICSDKIDLHDRVYTGVEPSPFLLERAKELYRSPSRRFVCGSAYALPFADKSFDACFSIAVWHLLSDPGKASAELSRVLKGDGKFLIVTANPGAYSAWTGRYTSAKWEGRRFEGTLCQPDKPHTLDVLYLHTLDEILHALTAANLDTATTETFRNDFYLAIQGQKRV